MEAKERDRVLRIGLVMRCKDERPGGREERVS